jgi:hypothetical protein
MEDLLFRLYRKEIELALLEDELALLEHDRVGANLCELTEGELTGEDWEDALIRSTEPPVDPVAYRDECEAMGKE